MSSYSVQNSFDDLAGIVHSTSIDQVNNPLGAATRAARTVLAMCDPDETRRFANIILYDQVSDYNLPMTDLKEKSIFDIRPQVNRRQRDNLGSRMSKDFDMKKGAYDQGTWGSWFSIENDTGVEYIRINKRFNPGAMVLDDVDNYLVWKASGGAYGLADDSLYSVDESGTSLLLNLEAGPVSPGIITNSTIVAQDYTMFNGIASFFLWVYMPATSTDVSGVTLQWGSSPANYWSQTGVLHFGQPQQGWNLFRFDWPTATQNGTVVPSAITYAQIQLAYTNAAGILGIRVNKLFASLPRIWKIGYYSNCLFRNAETAAWQDQALETSDLINLNATSYNLYLWELAKIALSQTVGADDEEVDKVENTLYGDPSKPKDMGLYAKYEKRNPSQAEKLTQTYYGRGGRLAYKRK